MNQWKRPERWARVVVIVALIVAFVLLRDGVRGMVDGVLGEMFVGASRR